MIRICMFYVIYSWSAREKIIETLKKKKIRFVNKWENKQILCD